MMELFSPIEFRSVKLPHRLIISPMATFRSNPQGVATDWHLAHYGRLAMGGAALVMVEATAVSAEGRNGYSCLGMYSDDQIAPMRRITDLMKDVGCVPAIQLNHAGRKGSWRRPWHGYTRLDEQDVAERGELSWRTYAPSAIPVSEGAHTPAELGHDKIAAITAEWVAAARRADRAGFELLEIHSAHGYLLNQFLSPIANHRTDGYGGSLENRMRLTCEVVSAVRAVWPEDKPLSVRISAVDGVEGGWTLDDSVALARVLKPLGVDMIDCTSGGIGGSATALRIPRTPGYQVPFAERIRQEAGIATIAVGLITEPELARDIIAGGRADLVAIGREALINPSWPAVARLKLQPERGYADWIKETGWWLERRTMSIAASAR